MIKAIISDADGTLVNTVYLIRHGQYEASVEYLKECGIPQEDIPTYEIYESCVNQSVGGVTRDTFEKTLRLLFGKSHNEYFKKIDLNQLDSRLTPIQDHIAPLYVHPFHGLTELFTWTGKSKTGFGIFTSGDRRMIVRNFGVSLPAMGYTELFRQDDISSKERFQAFIVRAKAVYGMPQLAIATCEDVIKTKPNPEGIRKLMDILGVGTEEVIVIGDLPVDMQAAHAAGVHAIGVSHGFGAADQLKTAGAVRVIDNLTLLPNLIDAHNNGLVRLF